ncbi:DUF4249 family protein [Algoriphagus sediminis]|uniref:DUF4249 family protein n=1 Tax=Algoriphagus sediminis TaxID=3057113 RepID=A0ABT7YFK1_9BACT|nr:DUF4249 family protein [Algoriphagus sediminis]MDN3205311.1 DUF4249 family protein [Algoriphagus sediminis]
MNRTIRLLSLLVVFLLFESCVDQIEFPLNLGNERLIVAGQLNDWNETQYVYLSETTSADREPILTDGYFTINDLPRPVRGAQVSVKSSTGQNWSYQEIEPGTYALEGFPGPESGVEYYVEILAKGRVYKSSPEVMPEVIGEDEISYTFDRGELNNQPEIPFISIRSDVTLPEQTGGYFLRWDVEEVYYWNLTFFPNPFNTPPPDCYVFGFADPERITLLNGDLLNRPGGTSSQILAERRIDQSFLSRHYFNVRQISTSQESYEYRRKVRELVNNSGSVFDAPPAPVQGNLRNINDEEEVVLGYFEVAKVDVTRIYTTKADVPFFIEEVCTFDPNRPLSDYPRTCLSCSEFDNSTGETPEWWFDQ